MKQIPYWLDTAPAFPDRSGKDLPDEADVVVIGGGLTGLSTAYTPPARAPGVVLVEKDKVGSGASGRNGSMCTQGITIGVGEARKRYGQERTRELYDAFREAVDVVEKLTVNEQIDCDFNGPAASASRSSPSTSGHEGQAARPGRELRSRTTLLSRSRTAGGARIGLLPRRPARPAQRRPARGQVRPRHGRGRRTRRSDDPRAQRGDRMTRDPGGRFLVETLHGTIRARQVMAATDAYTDKSMPWFRSG